VAAGRPPASSLLLTLRLTSPPHRGSGVYSLAVGARRGPEAPAAAEEEEPAKQRWRYGIKFRRYYHSLYRAHCYEKLTTTHYGTTLLWNCVANWFMRHARLLTYAAAHLLDGMVAVDNHYVTGRARHALPTLSRAAALADIDDHFFSCHSCAALTGSSITLLLVSCSWRWRRCATVTRLLLRSAFVYLLLWWRPGA